MNHRQLPIVIRVRISEKMLSDVTAIASRQERSISEIVRKAILHYIRKRLV